MTLSLSGKIRKQLATLLWPAAFEPPPDPNIHATYAGDGLVTYHNSDFLIDPEFQRAYAAGKATGSWSEHDLHWRAYVVLWAASRGRSLEGDYVECGVNRGGFARMIAEYIGLADLEKNFYLIDTFRGVPDEFVSPELRETLEGRYEECYDDVVTLFSPFPNAVVVRGVVPQVLEEVRPNRVCFLSIDMNCVAPSIATAEHFWPILSSGAAIMLDDYGFSIFRDQKAAFDEFARVHGVEVLALPTGQGLLIKP